VKPSLGTAFGYCADVTLLVQETGKLFGMVDEAERERTKNAPGLRAVVEVIKSRVAVS
jgi:DNA repair protein RAD51